MQDKEILITIRKSIDSSMELRNKKDLIENFIDSLTPQSDVDNDWKTFIEKSKKEELNKLIKEENLNPKETEKFIADTFRDGFVQTTGTAITKILPPVSRFSPTGDRAKKREIVLEKIKKFFNRYNAL